MAVREQVDHLVANISQAIQASDLLSLLVQQQRFPRRILRQPRDLSEIPKSILDERVRPIRSVLENIDAQKLLGLEVLPPNAKEGPHLRDGVHCRSIYDQIKLDSDFDNDVSMSSTDDDSSDNDNRSSMVRYLHIAEVPDEYTIGIFVFGPNERIPLHDHPEMCVLSRVLYGDLQRLSLDLDRKGRSPNDENFDSNIMDIAKNIMDIDDDVEDNNMQSEDDINNSSISSIRNFLEKQNNIQTESNHNHNSSSSFLASLSRSANWFFNGSSSSGIVMESEHEQQYPEGTKLAYRNVMDTLVAPNVASLYPYEGNLHEFVAGPYGAAVLDVLLPPYDDEHRRDCTFYHIRDIPATPNSNKRRARRVGNNSRFKSRPAATTTTTTTIAPIHAATTSPKSNTQREPCLIVPTGQPENFHCKSGRYKDLGGADYNDI